MGARDETKFSVFCKRNEECATHLACAQTNLTSPHTLQAHLRTLYSSLMSAPPTALPPPAPAGDARGGGLKGIAPKAKALGPTVAGSGRLGLDLASLRGFPALLQHLRHHYLPFYQHAKQYFELEFGVSGCDAGGQRLPLRPGRKTPRRELDKMFTGADFSIKGDRMYVDVDVPGAFADEAYVQVTVWAWGGTDVASRAAVARGALPLSAVATFTSAPPKPVNIPLALLGPGLASDFEDGVGPIVTAAKGGVSIDAAALFLPMRPGVLVVTAMMTRALRRGDLSDADSKQCKPYLKATVVDGASRGAAATTARSPVASGGNGVDADFDSERLTLWCDGTSWNGGLELAVWDEPLPGDPPRQVGATRVSLLDWSRDAFPHTERLAIRLPGSNAPTGYLSVGRRFYPAGRCTVSVLEGRNLRGAETTLSLGGTSASVDEAASAPPAPYIVAQSLGALVSPSLTTPVASLKPGTSNCAWGRTLAFDLVDHRELRLALGDGLSGSLIGEVAVDVGNVYKLGAREAWIPLKRPGAPRSAPPCGEVKVKVQFEAPPSIAYPQMCPPAVPIFEDSSRKALRPREELAALFGRPTAPGQSEIVAAMGEPEDDRVAAAAASDIVPSRRAGDEDDDAKDSASVAPDTDEDAAAEKKKAESEEEDEVPFETFTDDEVKAAFEALDLDSNHYLGASEIKHMLLCMGEAVSDREVDAMVRLLDEDGDGMVSLHEFWAMAMHAAPGGAKWQLDEEVDRARAHWRAKGYAAPVSPGAAGPAALSPSAGIAAGAALRAFRAAEAQLRAKRRAVILAFDAAHKVRLPELRYAYDYAKKRGLLGKRLSRHQLADAFNVPALDAPFIDLFTAFLRTEADDGTLLADEAAAMGKPLSGLGIRSGPVPGTTTEGVDLRELLIGWAGLAAAEATKEQRLKLLLDCYDSSGRGAVSGKDLVEIIRSAPLGMSVFGAVRKANVILKKPNNDDALGFYTLGGLEDAAVSVPRKALEEATKRFPNIFLPDVDAVTAQALAAAANEADPRRLAARSAHAASRSAWGDAMLGATNSSGDESVGRGFSPGALQLGLTARSTDSDNSLGERTGRGRSLSPGGSVVMTPQGPKVLAILGPDGKPVPISPTGGGAYVVHTPRGSVVMAPRSSPHGTPTVLTPRVPGTPQGMPGTPVIMSAHGPVTPVMTPHGPMAMPVGLLGPRGPAAFPPGMGMGGPRGMMPAPPRGPPPPRPGMAAAGAMRPLSTPISAGGLSFPSVPGTPRGMLTPISAGGAGGGAGPIAWPMPPTGFRPQSLPALPGGPRPPPPRLAMPMAM